MDKSKVIYTIGRQFGSGGRKVGRTLAEKLGIPFYDKELLTLAAKDSGLSEALFHNADEKPTSSLLYSLVMGNYPMSSGALGFNEMPLNDQLFLIQSKTIKKIADQGSCVLIGRCADYILRDHPRHVNIFITADMRDRIARLRETNAGISESDAEIYLEKADKKRSSYYNYYSNKTWGAAATYHLCINSSVFGLDRTTEYIKAFIDEKLQLK